VLINKDSSRSVSMELEIGSAATRFDAIWLRGTSLSSTTGQTLGGAIVENDGSWARQPEEPMMAGDGQLTVLLPAASAVMLRSLS